MIVLTFPGPTICPYAMEHVEVTGITVISGYTSSDKPAPKLFEVSPDAYNEQIVEIEVTGTPTDETPKILTPSTPDEISTTVSVFKNGSIDRYAFKHLFDYLDS